MEQKKHIISIIEESIKLREVMVNDLHFIEQIDNASHLCIEAIKYGKKVYIFGNGGSASDALHMAGELIGRFQKERNAFGAVSLNADVAVLTAIANDYGYDHIFSRQLEGLLCKGDVVIGLSTSGNSKNVCNGLKLANDKGHATIALLGKDGGEIMKIADNPILISSGITARIQECHIMVIHIICDLIELALCREV